MWMPLQRLNGMIMLMLMLMRLLMLMQDLMVD
jgi:hypothetical protein